MDRVVGVDVSKAQLDAYELGAGQRLQPAPTGGQHAAGIARLAAWAGPGALVVMEASGGYERLTHRHLLERGLAVAIVNASGYATSPRRADGWPSLSSGRRSRTLGVEVGLVERVGRGRGPARRWRRSSDRGVVDRRPVSCPSPLRSLSAQASASTRWIRPSGSEAFALGGEAEVHRPGVGTPASSG